MSKKTDVVVRLYGWRNQLGFGVVILLGLYFGLHSLGTLPPGLSPAEAANAATVLGVLKKTLSLRSLFSHNPLVGLYDLMLILSVKIFGTAVLGLRLPSVLIGLGATGLTYWWGKLWFSQRIGLLASLFMATTPWVVGFSRLGTAAILSCLIIPAILISITQAIRTKQLLWEGLAGLVIGLALASVTGVWVLLALVVAGFPAFRAFAKAKSRQATAVLLLTLIIIGLPLGFLRFRHSRPQLNLKNLSLITVARHTSSTFAMFVIHGDDNYQYNIPATPELNLFVGLMFVVGILVCGLHIERARYRTLLVLLMILFIPVVAGSGGMPNSLVALVLAPLVMILSACGINYMLEVWYSTFPINSAARTVGTVPIVLLLLLGIYQGYRQYFVAWSNAPELSDIFNNDARELAGYLNRTDFAGERYVVASGSSQQTIDFLSHTKAIYTSLDATQISALPSGNPQKQIIFIPSQTADLIKTLKSHFPKARLSQHYSEFNNNVQTFAVYETEQ